MKEYTDEQLADELARRKNRKQPRKPPQAVDNPDWNDVKKLCNSYLIAEYSDHRDDLAPHILEAALDALYGAEVWLYLKENQS